MEVPFKALAGSWGKAPLLSLKVSSMVGELGLGWGLVMKWFLLCPEEQDWAIS